MAGWAWQGDGQAAHFKNDCGHGFSLPDGGQIFHRIKRVTSSTLYLFADHTQDSIRTEKSGALILRDDRFNPLGVLRLTDLEDADFTIFRRN
jgi:hypothetical protein